MRWPSLLYFLDFEPEESQTGLQDRPISISYPCPEEPLSSHLCPKSTYYRDCPPRSPCCPGTSFWWPRGISLGAEGWWLPFGMLMWLSEQLLPPELSHQSSLKPPGCSHGAPPCLSPSKLPSLQPSSGTSNTGVFHPPPPQQTLPFPGSFLLNPCSFPRDSAMVHPGTVLLYPEWYCSFIPWNHSLFSHQPRPAQAHHGRSITLPSINQAFLAAFPREGTRYSYVAHVLPGLCQSSVGIKWLSCCFGGKLRDISTKTLLCLPLKIFPKVK